MMIDVDSLIDAIEAWCGEKVPRRILDVSDRLVCCPMPQRCDGCMNNMDRADLSAFAGVDLCRGCMDAVIRLRPLLRRMAEETK